MTTLLKEVYNLYKIYTKLNSALTNSTIVNESFCREIKAMILNDGCIAIKFAQWIISRLRSEPGKHIEYIVNYFDDIFDNCPFHDMNYTNSIFDEYSYYPLSDLIQPNSLKEIVNILTILTGDININNAQLQKISNKTKLILDDMYKLCQYNYLTAILALVKADLNTTVETANEDMRYYEQLKSAFEPVKK